MGAVTFLYPASRFHIAAAAVIGTRLDSVPVTQKYLSRDSMVLL